MASSREVSELCGRAYLPGLNRAGVHEPEEHAKAAVRAIMRKHGPELRRALSSNHQGSGNP